jgi:hypothetical protein
VLIGSHCKACNTKPTAHPYMLLQQETVNRQDIIAIRSFEKEVSENLSNLCITEYADFIVMSVYSDLTRNLQAYKVLQKSGIHEDSWMTASFNKKIHMDFNGSFNLIPRKLASQGGDDSEPETEIEVEYAHAPGYVHYSKGLLKHHAYHKDNAVYVYRNQDNYSIFVFKGRHCVFANSFKCENELELLYFLINSLEINSMSQEDTSLFTDYSMMENPGLMEFLQPYFLEAKTLRLEHDGIDDLIPNLHEMLFANHLLSLCA